MIRSFYGLFATDRFVRIPKARSRRMRKFTAKPVLEALEERAVPAGGVLQFSSAQFFVNENAGLATITVTRANGSDGTVGVNYASGRGDARPGVDYVATSGTLTFGPGETQKSFSVTVMSDGQINGNVTFGLTLSNATGGATLGTPSSTALTIIDKDGTPTQRFVNNVYLEVLGRVAEPAGLATWTALINTGNTSRSQVVAAIEASTEARTFLVQSLYNKFLLRPADAIGLNGFSGFLQGGGTIAQLKAVIFGSDEYFQSIAGGTNDAFLDELYLDVFDRNVDASGRANWLQTLASGVSRAQVALAVVTSAEAYNLQVQNYYQDFLNRPADQAGLAAWVSMLQQATRDEQILAMFLGSDEYYSLL